MEKLILLSCIFFFAPAVAIPDTPMGTKTKSTTAVVCRVEIRTQ